MRVADLDQYFPPAGSCAFCGHEDQRHRLWDAFMGAAHAGDTPEGIASAWGYPVEAVRAVLAVRPYQPPPRP